MTPPDTGWKNIIMLLNKSILDKLKTARWPWKFSTQIAWLENLVKANMAAGLKCCTLVTIAVWSLEVTMLVNFPLFQGRVIKNVAWNCSFFLIFTMPWPWPKYLWSVCWQIFCCGIRKISGYIKDVAKGSPIFLKIFVFIPRENLFINKYF